MGLPKSWKFLFVALVIAITLSQEAEARRTILKGRRVVTRNYLREASIPAWAVVLLVGLGEIIAGAVVFFIMKRIIIDTPLTGRYTPADIEEP